MIRPCPRSRRRTTLKTGARSEISAWHTWTTFRVTGARVISRQAAVVTGWGPEWQGECFSSGHFVRCEAARRRHGSSPFTTPPLSRSDIGR